jgi:hypothetical protein
MRGRRQSCEKIAPIGTGDLHQALEGARELAALHAFCSAHVCTPAEVSDDSKHLHLPRVLQLMRNRGYQVEDPVPAPHQPKKGFTAWLVHIRMSKVKFDMAFYTPNAPKSGGRKKSPTPHMEPA